MHGHVLSPGSEMGIGADVGTLIENITEELLG